MPAPSGADGYSADRGYSEDRKDAHPPFIAGTGK